MRIYNAPELKVTLFDVTEEIMCASNTENETPVTSTKQEVTGDGPGIVLPDDEW